MIYVKKLITFLSELFLYYTDVVTAFRSLLQYKFVFSLGLCCWQGHSASFFQPCCLFIKVSFCGDSIVGRTGVINLLGGLFASLQLFCCYLRLPFLFSIVATSPLSFFCSSSMFKFNEVNDFFLLLLSLSCLF